MNYLVTGGSGCIGSYVMRDLLARGDKVVNFDFDMGQGIMQQVIPPEGLNEVIMVSGDITDLAHIMRIVKEHHIDKIIHLASWQIPASNANPPQAIPIVLGGLANILEAARLLDVKKVVWASSIAVFGSPAEYGNKKVANDAHHRPQSVYGACKSAGEFLLNYYHTQYGVSTVGLRYTAVYGVGRERGASSFTTEMIRKAVAGEHYDVPFSEDNIDWQYVEDVSAVTVRAADVESTTSRVFNTQGNVHPVTTGVNYLKSLMPSASFGLLPGRFGIAWEYDTSAVETELGFIPTYTMESGILKTLNIYLERAGRKPVVPN